MEKLIDNIFNDIIIMSLCDICCEPFTIRDRTEMICPRLDCGFICCKICIKTYILQGLSSPHCMKCKYEYNDSYIINNITRKFFKTEYKNKKMEILLNLEKSLIPSTQKDAKIQKLINEENKKITSIKFDILDLHNKINNLNNIIRLKKSYISDCHFEITRLRETNHDKTNYIMKCQNEECQGYLSSSYKCGLCDKYTCSKCLFIKEDEHECNEDTVKSAELIKNDTKPCPKCSARIYKIEGCDQMWCTSCNTAFNWNSGTLVYGNVHNPHYFEFLRNGTRETPRTYGDIPCGGIPSFDNIYNNYILPNTIIYRKDKGNVKKMDTKYYDKNYTILFYEHTRFIQYNLKEYNTFTTFTYEVRNILNDDLFKKYRIKFILNEITEEEWKHKIYIINQEEEKKKNYRQIMEMLFNISFDILRKYKTIIDNFDPMLNLENIYNEIIKMKKEFINIFNYINNVQYKKIILMKKGDYMIIRRGTKESPLYSTKICSESYIKSNIELFFDN